MTSIYGLTGGAHKQSGKGPIVVPRTVIYDRVLTYGLPAAVTGPSAFNALAHGVEALYGPGHNRSDRRGTRCPTRRHRGTGVI